MTGMVLQDTHCKVTGRGDSFSIHHRANIVNV